MSKGRQGEIKIKQTEQLGLTAEGNEEEMKSRENSDNLPQNKVSIKLKQRRDTARHGLVGHSQSARHIPSLHPLLIPLLDNTEFLSEA